MLIHTLLLCRTLELKDNTIIVVLGASGDLAKKKTVSLGSRSMQAPESGLSILAVSCAVWLGKANPLWPMG